MPSSKHKRSADSSIRGYLYQFDATICALLALQDNEPLTIEGIEDFDVRHGDDLHFYQCKYLASTRLTPSALGDAVRQMFAGYFLRDRPANRICRYTLYGYFKDSTPSETGITPTQLQQIITYPRPGTTSCNTNDQRYYFLPEHSAPTQDDLRIFCDRFNLLVCHEYEKHREETIRALRDEFDVSKEEATLYHYPSARSFVSEIAASPNVEIRTISKSQLISAVRPTRLIYDLWTLREDGTEAYCRRMRKLHFTFTNIDAANRFFIIEVSTTTSAKDLFKISQVIQDKWSTHKQLRRPDKERFAPFIYFRNAAQSTLAEAKRMLRDRDFIFTDGYPFANSPFDIKSLLTPQTATHPISLRYCNSEIDLAMAVNTVTGKVFIYDLFIEATTSLATPEQVIAIPILSLDNIPQIL